MSILVLKLSGKGSSGADFVSVHSFDNIEQANIFILENTQTDRKYWHVANIVKTDEIIETYLEALV